MDLPPRIFLHQRLDYAMYVTTKLYVKSIESFRFNLFEPKSKPDLFVSEYSLCYYDLHICREMDSKFNIVLKVNKCEKNRPSDEITQISVLCYFAHNLSVKFSFFSLLQLGS